MWKELAGIAEDAWRDVIDMQNAKVAVSTVQAADWPEDSGAAGPPGQAEP